MPGEEERKDDLQALHMLLRFRRLMGRLLLLMLGMVLLGMIGLKRHAAPWAVRGVFAGAALSALAMLLTPIWLAFRSRPAQREAAPPSKSLDDFDHPKAP